MRRTYVPFRLLPPTEAISFDNHQREMRILEIEAEISAFFKSPIQDFMHHIKPSRYMDILGRDGMADIMGNLRKGGFYCNYALLKHQSQGLHLFVHDPTYMRTPYDMARSIATEFISREKDLALAILEGRVRDFHSSGNRPVAGSGFWDGIKDFVVESMRRAEFEPKAFEMAFEAPKNIDEFETPAMNSFMEFLGSRGVSAEWGWEDRIVNVLWYKNMPKPIDVTRPSFIFRLAVPSWADLLDVKYG